jgi:radical SAM superfamily enzyme YgiQ (UPF0313 family)
MRIRIIQPPLVQPRYRQLTLPVVGAELAAQGLTVEACDENVEPVDLSDVDLVGISCHVYNAPRAITLAAAFRRRGIPVIMGGTFATTAPQLLAPHCDSVVVGELEGQSAELAADARAGRLKPVYRAASPPSLARTVRPDFSLLKNRRYWRYNFPIELSRGCRFACRFCTSHLLFPEPRTRSLDDIARDLAQHDHGFVEVVDVNFLNDPAFFRRAAPLLGAARGPGWLGQTTVADLAADPGLPQLLASTRCRAVFVGLETTSREGLRSIDKGWCKPEVFIEMARRLREVGVLVQAGVIVGLDTDTPASLAETARWLEAARAQTVSFTFLHYYPGTPQFEEMAKQGRLDSDDWSDYDGNHPVIRQPSLSPEELRSALRRFLGRLYSFRSIARRAWHRGMLRRPGQIVHHLVTNLAMRAYYRRLLR